MSHISIKVKIYRSILLTACLFCSAIAVNAQAIITPPKANWQNLDLASDGIVGISTEKAYRELLTNKAHQSVIVAVIDGGVDINHEDLKKVIYVNSKDVSNQQDDDKNGYIDDVNGWNFIGSAKGDVQYDNWEIVRIIREQRSKYENARKSSFKGEELASYKRYYELKKEIEKRSTTAQSNLQNFIKVKEIINGFLSSLNNQNPTAAELKSLRVRGDAEKFVMQTLLKRIVLYDNVSALIKEEIDEPIKQYGVQLYYKLNINFTSRDTVGDDYTNSRESNYGNANVIGPDASHGSHVAGIIAADRSNSLGIMGVANDVIIMPVRAVPNGDERDKDIANAIRYAVNNGAKILNMSFGKDYSHDKQVVDDAVKYAMSKGVLIVHAAGNDNQDKDKTANYPNRNYADKSGTAEAWIEVGASGPFFDNTLKAGFSNYGKTTVDVFAPGVSIRSTTPNSTYESNSGTSMAAPVVSGLAALIWSYYPQLTAVQVKEIILKSVTKIESKTAFKTGDSSVELLFADLCSSGGIVNAYNALKLAATY